MDDGGGNFLHTKAGTLHSGVAFRDEKGEITIKLCRSPSIHIFLFRRACDLYVVLYETAVNFIFWEFEDRDVAGLVGVHAWPRGKGGCGSRLMAKYRWWITDIIDCYCGGIVHIATCDDNFNVRLLLTWCCLIARRLVRSLAWEWGFDWWMFSECKVRWRKSEYYANEEFVYVFSAVWFYVTFVDISQRHDNAVATIVPMGAGNWTLFPNVMCLPSYPRPDRCTL